VPYHFQYPTLRIVLCNSLTRETSTRTAISLSVSYPTDRSLQPGRAHDYRAEDMAFQYPTLRIVLCNLLCPELLYDRPELLSVSYPTDRSLQPYSMTPTPSADQYLSVSYPTDRSLQRLSRIQECALSYNLSVSYPTDRSLQRDMGGGACLIPVNFQYPTLRIVLCNPPSAYPCAPAARAFSILPYGSFSATFEESSWYLLVQNSFSILPYGSFSATTTVRRFP